MLTTNTPLSDDGKWEPIRSGDYDRDCEHGRQIAKDTLAMIAATENPALFGTVVRAITAGGQFDGVETGFCSAIGIFIVVNA